MVVVDQPLVEEGDNSQAGTEREGARFGEEDRHPQQRGAATEPGEALDRGERERREARCASHARHPSAVVEGAEDARGEE